MRFSDKLAEICGSNFKWKRGLTIPKKGQPDTRAKLVREIQRLGRGLERNDPAGFMQWSEGKLYCEFFERAAELKMKTDFPEAYADLVRARAGLPPQSAAVRKPTRDLFEEPWR